MCATETKLLTPNPTPQPLLPGISVCAGRVSLLLLLIQMAGGAWVVENPASSVVFKHDRLQWLLRFLKRCRMFVARLLQIRKSLVVVRLPHLNSRTPLAQCARYGALHSTWGSTAMRQRSRRRSGAMPMMSTFYKECTLLSGNRPIPAILS